MGRPSTAFVKWSKHRAGDVSQIDDLNKLPQARLKEAIPAKKSGYIANIFADKVGLASLALGAGRATKEDAVDHAVGIEVRAAVGDSVSSGDLLMTIHANSETTLRQAQALLDAAIEYSDAPAARLPLFYGVIDGSEV